MCLPVDQGKGNKDRYVPLSPRLLEELREYWRRVRPEHWMFPNQLLGRPMSRHGPAHIYSRAKEKAGIAKPGGVHTLRHCYANRPPASSLAAFEPSLHFVDVVHALDDDAAGRGG